MTIPKGVYYTVNSIIIRYNKGNFGWRSLIIENNFSQIPAAIIHLVKCNSLFSKPYTIFAEISPHPSRSYYDLRCFIMMPEFLFRFTTHVV